MLERVASGWEQVAFIHRFKMRGPQPAGGRQAVEVTRRRLHDLATARHGVVTAADVRRSNLPTSTFHKWRKREELAHPAHDVTILPGHPRTPEQRAAIAVAAVGQPCAVTGWSAAFLYGLRPTAPTRIEVLVPHGSSHRPHPNVRIHETSVFDTEDITDVSGLPVVAPARMLVDLARTTLPDTLIAMAIDLRGHHLLRSGDLDAELQRRRRFPGRARARTLAEAIREDGSDSGFEHRTRDRLTRRGTPPDPGQLEVQVAGNRRRLDLPYAKANVGIECLGYAYHSDQTAFERDADRRNDFAVDGTWRILELTWTTFLTGWDGFAARLEQLLQG